MSENYLDDLFDQLVTVEPHPAWNDVLARARRSRRRYGALVAAVAVFVLVPAAWAVNGAFTAPPPPQVQAAAAAWNRLLPQMLQAAARDGYTPTDAVPVDLSKLHGLEQVQTPDGHLDVWGGPSSDGGHLCWLMAFETDRHPEAGTAQTEDARSPGGWPTTTTSKSRADIPTSIWPTDTRTMPTPRLLWSGLKLARTCTRRRCQWSTVSISSPLLATRQPQTHGTTSSSRRLSPTTRAATRSRHGRTPARRRLGLPAPDDTPMIRLRGAISVLESRPPLHWRRPPPETPVVP